MMKCTICGRRTLPGAKLCLPCRAALRRARDDTISELLPLPGRVGALAAQGASTVSRTLDLVAERRAKRRSKKSTKAPSDQQKTLPPYPPLRIAAIVLFVLAVGFLAYGFAQQLRGDAHASPMHEPAPVAVATAHTSVSPESLAAEARNSVLAPAPVIVEAEPEGVPEAAVVPPPKPAKITKGAVRQVAKVEAPTIMPVIVVPPVVVAAASPPAPRPAAAPDRWQLLSAALGRCTGNVFSRIGCEHAARAQYCDGYWGQVVQCPGGVANDHGQ